MLIATARCRCCFEVYMKVTILSRKAAEAAIKSNCLQNSAVISFYDPGDTLLDYSGVCDRVLSVAIHDRDPSALADVGLTVERYFPEADAVAEFIYKSKADGLDIVCQCEYGQSRSAACAAAILQHFSRRGIDVFADYRYYPNQLVYHKVFDALERYKTRL